MELVIVVVGLVVLYVEEVLLAGCLVSTAVHGGAEVKGWWRKRRERKGNRYVWVVFLLVQLSFAAMAAVGLLICPPVIWALAAFKFIDSIGFHVLFYSEWPGRTSAIWPFSEAVLLTMWLVA